MPRGLQQALASLILSGIGGYAQGRMAYGQAQSEAEREKAEREAESRKEQEQTKQETLFKMMDIAKETGNYDLMNDIANQLMGTRRETFQAPEQPAVSGLEQIRGLPQKTQEGLLREFGFWKDQPGSELDTQLTEAKIKTEEAKAAAHRALAEQRKQKPTGDPAKDRALEIIQTNIRSLLAQIKAYEDKAVGGYIDDPQLNALLNQLDTERQKLEQLTYVGDRATIPGF